MKRLMSDLNRLYREQPALHRLDFFAEGFDWVDCSDASQSVISFLRKSEGQTLLVVVNFTPVPRQDYRVGVSQGGAYRELLNSDAGLYGGSNMGNGGGVMAEPVEWMGRSHSLSLTLPPLSVLIMQPEEG